MANIILYSQQNVEDIANTIQGLASNLYNANHILQQVNLDPIAGGDLRVDSSISLSGLTSQRVTGNTVRSSVYSFSRAVSSYSVYCRDLASTLKQVSSLFESAEHGISGVLTPITDLIKKTSTDRRGTNRKIETKQDYYSMIKERAANAIDEDCKKLYEKYINQIYIFSDSYNGNAHYNPLLNLVFINWENDATNPRGQGATYFHEVGHMIDDYTKWWGDSSSSEAFTRSLQSDFENYVRKVMEENSCSREDAYGIISDWLMTDPDNKEGISDLCGGLSGNQCLGKWGHSTSYWSGRTEHGIAEKVNNEAFAHFFEASMSDDPTKLNYLKEIFPTAYAEFKKIVQSSI